MGRVIGIDLGTTFSAVATLDESGRPLIVHDREGSSLTPSVVSFTDERAVEVGEGPRRVMWTDSATTGRFKRKMGTSWAFEVGNRTFTPTDLSALVLRRLREDAERALGPVDLAVVTIPANFSSDAREATLEAARRAGLKVEHIVNEPTAAALYYAFKSGGELSGVYAVYDLGGGTFDISIIRVSGHDIEVVATDGIAQLGGTDFDVKLQELIRAKYRAETGGGLDPEDFTPNQAEEEKKSLSRRTRTLARVSGPAGRTNIECTRVEFEQAISAYIAQCEMLCEGVLEKAGVTRDDIREVFLVGGSTRIPFVKQSVERVFGRAPIDTENVDDVVALGAALYAAYRAQAFLSPIQRKAIERISVQEITSKCFGTLALIEEERGQKKLVNSIIIPKGHKVPCEETATYYTVVEGQVAIDCSVTESNAEESDPRFVKVIWKDLLKLPPGRPAGQEISVTYAYDHNQVMKCAFTDVETGEKQEVDLQMAKLGGGGAADIDQFRVE